jgi:hypothetical protein
LLNVLQLANKKWDSKTNKKLVSVRQIIRQIPAKASVVGQPKKVYCEGNAINKPMHSNGRLPNITHEDSRYPSNRNMCVTKCGLNKFLASAENRTADVHIVSVPIIRRLF